MAETTAADGVFDIQFTATDGNKGDSKRVIKDKEDVGGCVAFWKTQLQLYKYSMCTVRNAPNAST